MMKKNLKLKNPEARSQDSGENDANFANLRGVAVFGFRVFNVRLEESVLSVGRVGRVWERLGRSWRGTRGVPRLVLTAYRRFADIWGVLGIFGDICSKWHGGGGGWDAAKARMEDGGWQGRGARKGGRRSCRLKGNSQGSFRSDWKLEKASWGSGTMGWVNVSQVIPRISR